jgi:hypothetical protein
MLTLISTLVGLLGSFIPGLLNFFTTRQNNDYQLELIKLQMAAAREGQQLQIDAAQSKADIEQQQLLYSYDAGTSGSKLVDALRATVRPIITYVFFGLWCMIEFVTFFYAIHQGMSFDQIIPLIWTNNNEAVFVTIIAFWFGARLLDKYTIFPPINQPKTAVKK